MRTIKSRKADPGTAMDAGEVDEHRAHLKNAMDAAKGRAKAKAKAKRRKTGGSNFLWLKAGGSSWCGSKKVKVKWCKHFPATMDGNIPARPSM